MRFRLVSKKERRENIFFLTFHFALVACVFAIDHLIVLHSETSPDMPIRGLQGESTNLMRQLT
jgi:hypothetical protein